MWLPAARGEKEWRLPTQPALRGYLYAALTQLPRRRWMLK
jgi:hypothetical protein